jgi:hypothetical protein
VPRAKDSRTEGTEDVFSGLSNVANTLGRYQLLD